MSLPNVDKFQNSFTRPALKIQLHNTHIATLLCKIPSTRNTLDGDQSNVYSWHV